MRPNKTYTVEEQRLLLERWKETQFGHAPDPDAKRLMAFAEENLQLPTTAQKDFSKFFAVIQQHLDARAAIDRQAIDAVARLETERADAGIDDDRGDDEDDPPRAK